MFEHLYSEWKMIHELISRKRDDIEYKNTQKEQNKNVSHGYKPQLKSL